VFDLFRRFGVIFACVAIVAGGATLAIAAKGGKTTSGGTSSASTFEYGTGGQGCTPGYWKQVHPKSWVTYKPTDLFDTVFGVKLFPKMTLLEVLEQGGGGYIALGRHAVAALLNTANSNVNYGLSPAQVIKLVQEAVKSGDPTALHTQFEKMNESGCSIDAHGDPIPKKK
jgi:hypothetical protein